MLLKYVWYNWIYNRFGKTGIALIIILFIYCSRILFREDDGMKITIYTTNPFSSLDQYPEVCAVGCLFSVDVAPKAYLLVSALRLCLEWNLCINVFSVQEALLSVVSGICILVCLPCNRNPWFSRRYIFTKMVYFALWCLESHSPFTFGVVIDYARYMQRQSYKADTKAMIAIWIWTSPQRNLSQ